MLHQVALQSGYREFAFRYRSSVFPGQITDLLPIIFCVRIKVRE